MGSTTAAGTAIDDARTARTGSRQAIRTEHLSAGKAPNVTAVPNDFAHPDTPTACLAALLATAPSRPVLTSVRSDERIDLSATTLANWVAKAANFLLDDLGLAPGDGLALAMPRHWLAAVWVLAADAVGAATEVLPVEESSIDVPAPTSAPVASLVDPGVAARAATQAAFGDVLVGTLRPFALPVDPPPIPPARDFVVEVRSCGDDFHGPVGDPEQTLFTAAGTNVTRHDAMDTARQIAARHGWDSRSRVLSTGPLTTDALVSQLLAPWSVGGSVVWAGNLEEAELVSVMTHEGVTERMD